MIRSYDNSPDPPFNVVREGLSWHYFGGLGVGALAQWPQGEGTTERWLHVAHAGNG